MEQAIGNEVKVSIVIPVYNHEKFVGDCIQSILNQTYKNIEVILCDDCSKDNSWEVIQKYKGALSDHFNRIILLKNESNQGITKTLNKMLEYVEGDYIKIIASDDMLVSFCIEKMVNTVDKTKLQILVSNGRSIDEEQHYPINDVKDKIYIEAPDFTKATMFERLYFTNFIFAPGAMVNREIYKKFGIYDETLFTEDWEFWLRISESGQVEFKYVDDELVYYRKSRNSMTSMAANAGFENRRINLHNTEMEILNRYKSKVSKRVYADKVVTTLLQERALAEEGNFKQLLNITKDEIKSFHLWYFAEPHKGFWFLKKRLRLL